MSILVFGGLGHVGSWIIHDLVQRGEDVVCLDSNAGAFDRLGYDYLAGIRDRFTLEQVDILDTHSLFEKMRAYDGQVESVIFCVAVIAGPDFAKRPFRNIEINTVGMLNVIEACRIFKVPKFINLSSGAVYGNSSGGQTESDTPYMATDLYCATKIANEVLALQYGQTYGMDIRNARLMAIYGPGKLPSRMHALYQVLFGPLEGLMGQQVNAGGDQAMDWTHVRDSARGVVALMDAPIAAGESFNVSVGKTFSHRDILRLVEEIVGQPTQMSMGAGKFLDRGSPLDTTKAQRVLNFKPVFSDIREGLIDYYGWLKRVRPTLNSER